MAYTTIDKPSDYFDTKLYTATASDLSITGLDFAPNWIWIKSRNLTGDHSIFDSVRGTGKQLQSNTTGAEFTTADALSAFNSDGFSITGTGNNYTNRDGRTYASWNWKAGTSFTNDASATGIGTIDSTGSVNTTSGFSICSYTGTGSAGTIKHGLSTAPKMIILKNRSVGANNWRVYHKDVGATKFLDLNTTAASSVASTIWNDTEPTSSVFSIGTHGSVSENGGNLIAYCFAEKKGYSKFGSYIGTNGGADGPFIFTGFKPAFVLIKDTSAANAWTIRDDKRNTYNPATNFLVPDSDAAEVTAGEAVDILSNGFKIKANGGKVQDSGNTYIYMAFAENPFVTSTGVPACAR
jgi:hypothetical protein